MLNVFQPEAIGILPVGLLEIPILLKFGLDNYFLFIYANYSCQTGIAQIDTCVTSRPKDNRTEPPTSKSACTTMIPLVDFTLLPLYP